MAEVTFKVYRYNPETGGNGRFQEFQVDYQSGETILDCLNKIKGEQDGTLTYRMSCRSAICGSCAMRICGHTRLACKTQVGDLLELYDEITVEPLQNFPVIKDLVVDLTTHWEKVEAVMPYLMPAVGEAPPEKERLQSPEQFDTVFEVATCIQCSACVSDCTSLEADEKFLAPAALAKAFRFAGDSRDAAEKERLSKLAKEGGIWDCVRCYECSQVCPKDVRPAEHIIRLREKALNNKLDHTVGARHVLGFMKSVGHSGQLDEAKLPRETVKGAGAVLSMAPIGMKMFFKGKLPMKHKPIPGVEDVERIYKKLEGE
jgi:succinate dehydrogenase / fumarate reductase iron-sulfur subunit